MNIRKVVYVIVSVFVLLQFSVIDAEASPRASIIKNCSDLLKKYPSGIAKSAFTSGTTGALVNKKIYTKYRKLDKNNDGVICESGPFENWSSITTVPTTTTSTIPTVPNAPTGLTLTVKSPFDGTGLLTWSDNSNNEDNFYISNVDPSKLAGLPLSSIWYKASMNQTSVTITGFSNGYTYCYWAIAANAVGNSTWSASICSLAGTATTTTTAYVPPTTPYIPPLGGGYSTSSNWLGCYFKGQRMWGSVYITSYSYLADFKVYQTSYSYLSDLKVYNTSYSYLASSCGIWYITPYSYLADFTIYLTPYSYLADFSIFTTSYSYLAGR